jgi:hypothetical protein
LLMPELLRCSRLSALSGLMRPMRSRLLLRDELRLRTGIGLSQLGVLMKQHRYFHGKFIQPSSSTRQVVHMAIIIDAFAS